MKLSKETLMSITKQIEETDLEDGWTNDQNLEVKQGTFTILVTYRVLGELVKEYNYHQEVLYNNIENMSHTDFIDAEISDIEAWDDTKDECIEIENLNELQYY